MKMVVDGQEYPYDPGSLMLSEARTIKKTLGVDAKDMLERAGNGDLEAMQALVWVTLKHAGKEVPVEDVDFDLGRTTIRLDDDDVAGVVEALAKMPRGQRTLALEKLDDDEREQVEALLASRGNVLNGEVEPVTTSTTE